MQSSSIPAYGQFLDYLRFEKRYSAHTLRAYADDLSAFLHFIDSQYGLQDPGQISAAMIRSWLAGLREEQMSSRSINRKISTLKSFYKFLLHSGNLQRSPMTQVTAPKASKRLPVFVKEEDMAGLLQSLQQSEDWKSLNARMLITLFYCTGMRLSELIRLKSSQVDAGRRLLKVLGKGSKERIIPLAPELLVQIQEYEELKRKEFDVLPETLLVTEKGRSLYPKYAYLLVRQYLGEIKTLDKKSPHVLRHSFATHLSNQGADLNAIKELLGHASLAATQVYTHTSIEQLREVYRKAHPKA